MTKKTLMVLAISSLVLVLAAPLAAETVRLTANIPFEFMASQRTLPAGEYSVESLILNAPGIMCIRSEDSHYGVFVLSNPLGSPADKTREEARLVFHRYGNQYFLSEVWGGYLHDGLVIPMSKAERALTETAMFRSPETVVILAQR
jgi:hypothetical protein